MANPGRDIDENETFQPGQDLFSGL